MKPLVLEREFSFDKENDSDIYEHYSLISLLLASKIIGEEPINEPEFIKGERYKITIEKIK